MLHAFQILEFVGPLCERARTAEARVAELERVLLECQEMADSGVFFGRIAAHALKAARGIGPREEVPGKSEVKR